MNNLLEQGISAVRAGRREEARTLLTQVVETDERNEHAWLWLSGVVDDPNDIATCLSNVLELNPANERARKGIAWVTARYGNQLQVPALAAAAATVQLNGAAAPHSTPTAVSPAATAATIKLNGAVAVQAGPAATAATIQLNGAALPPVAPASNGHTAGFFQLPPVEGPVSQQQNGTTPPPRPASLAPAGAAPADDEPAFAPADAAMPCVYCGAGTTAAQEHCPQCRKSLMIRGAARPSRSIWLTLMAILSGIGSVLTIIGGLLLFLSGILFATGTEMLSQQPELLEAELQNLPPGAELPAGFDIFQMLELFSGILYGIAIALLVGGVFYIFVTIGLWRRRRWAYIVAIIASVFSALGIGLNLVGVLIARTITADVLLNILGGGGMIALMVMSYRDFYGPLLRCSSTVESGDDVEHYNRGIAYKKLGMWYQASKEWETAVKQSPNDLSYLHALGLAYAQLKRFDQAFTTLERGLAVAPGHGQIRESLALVERMARGR